MKARTTRIARGEDRPSPNDAKVWFTSTEPFAQVLRNSGVSRCSGPRYAFPLFPTPAHDFSRPSALDGSAYARGLVPCRTGRMGRLWNLGSQAPMPSPPHPDLSVASPFEKVSILRPSSRRFKSAAEHSNRAAHRGRLLLASQAEQVDEVLMKFEPDRVIGVAIRRGEIAMIAHRPSRNVSMGPR